MVVSEKNVRLIEPCEEHMNTFLEAVEEFQALDDGFGGERSSWYGTVRLDQLRTNFSLYISSLRELASKSVRGPHLVRQRRYWLMDGSDFVGQVTLRYELPEDKAISGNVGYEIRPSKRRLGYGRVAVRLALEEARESGMTQLTVTCDANNVASRKLIEEHLGVLEGDVSSPDGHIVRRQYRIHVIPR